MLNQAVHNNAPFHLEFKQTHQTGAGWCIICSVKLAFQEMVGLVYPFRNANPNERRITMTCQDHCTLRTGLLEQIAADGFDALPDLSRSLLDAAMRVERQQYLGARPYERSPALRRRANGVGVPPKNCIGSA